MNERGDRVISLDLMKNGELALKISALETLGFDVEIFRWMMERDRKQTERIKELAASISENAAVDLFSQVMLPKKAGVYFVQASNGSIKIGQSHNMWKRMNSLQTGSPLTIWPVACIEDDFPDDSVYHTIFSSSRVRGEWFALTEELKKFIKEARTNP